MYHRRCIPLGGSDLGLQRATAGFGRYRPLRKSTDRLAPSLCLLVYLSTQMERLFVELAGLGLFLLVGFSPTVQRAEKPLRTLF